MPNDLRRVLSIDGGGIKGVFPAAFLAYLERDLGPPIGDFFDLIVGTSTGGILALGLGLGFRATEILRFYEHYGPGIFAGNGSRGLSRCFSSKLRHWVVAKYPVEPLREALCEVFEDRTLGQSKRRLVIPATHRQTGKVYLFKTPHHPRLNSDYACSAVDVALSTAAAPTYFPAFSMGGTVPLLDGGVWANNPIAIAAVEAVGVLNWDRRSTRILSLGCTDTPVDPGRLRQTGAKGRLFWAEKFVEANFAAQSSSALGMATHLVGKANVHRIDPPPPSPIDLDDVEAIPDLRDLAEFHARDQKPELSVQFLEKPADAFVPEMPVPAP